MSSKLIDPRRRFTRISSLSGAGSRQRARRRYPLTLLDHSLEDRTLLSIPGVSVQGGVLTITGDQDSPGENDVVTLASDTTSGFIDVSLNGSTETLPLTGANPINQILVNGLDGSNTLTVNSTNGLITQPIQYLGNTLTNSMTLTGATADSETYAVGQTPGSGTVTLTSGLQTESIQFQDLGSAIVDSIPAPMAVLGTPGNDLITYAEGINASIGVISFGTSSLVDFTAKTTLTIDSGSGTDVIDDNDPFTPTGLTAISVNGGPGQTADTLIDHNIPGIADTLYVTPTGPNAGTIDDLGISLGLPLAPELTFTNITAITAQGQAGDGDQIQYNGTTGNDTFDVVPGSAIDSGTILGAGGATPFAFVPVSFAGYSGTTSGVIADSAFGVGPTGGDDTVLVDGTAGNDTFTLEDYLNIPGFFDPQIEVDTGLGDRTPVFFDHSSGVDNIVFRGQGGSDIYVTNFGIINAFPGVGITVQGNGNDMLEYTSTLLATTNVDLDTSTITSTLANPLTFSGIGTTTINDLFGSASISGTAGTGQIAYDPTGTNAASVILPTLNETFAFSFVYQGFTINPGTGTLSIDGTTGDDLFDLAGVTDTTATVNVNGLLTANLVTSSTLNVVIASGTGNDSVLVDSTTNPFTSPIQFSYGGGQDQLELSGGTATTDTYTAYSGGASQSVLTFAGGTETVTVAGIYGVLDNVTVPVATTGDLPTTDVIATASDSTINYQVGVLATTDGLVTVDTEVPLEFTNKASLGLEGGPGNDTININNPDTPTGLTAIGVDGGSGQDQLVVNAFGNTGLVTTPGLLAITTLVPIAYTNIEAIQLLNVPVPVIAAVPGVTFLGNAGVPLNGVIVAAFTAGPLGYPSAPASSFTASINWGDGTPATPGTVVASPGGGYVVLGSHTYALAKTYSVVVSVLDSGSNPSLTVGGVPISLQDPGSSTPVSLTATPGVIAQSPLLVVGQPVTGTAGVAIPAGTPVATFTDAGGAKPLADYGATITYTIGSTPTTVPATIVYAPGSTSNFIVETSAPLTLLTPGTYSFVVGVGEGPSTPPQTAGAVSTVTINPVPVTDYPIVATGAGGSITGREDLPLTPGTVLATWTYSNPLGITGEFLGTISWGDGSSSTFTSANLTTVGAAGASQVQILATSSTLTHTYTVPGSYQIVIVIDHPISPTAMGSSAVVVDSVTVLDAPLVATPVPGATKMGVGFIGPVASFLDTAPNGALGDYIATISWGDGVTTLGAIAAGPTTGFVVTGTHVYSTPGAYPVLVTIKDEFGASTSVVSTITVSASTLTVASSPNHVVTAGSSFTGVFGSFTSSDPLAAASDFSVTLSYGDGTTGPGTVSEDSHKVFHITGTHAYANPSLSTVIPVTFSVVDTSVTGGSSLTGAAGSHVVVSDAPLSLFQGATITSLQGISTGLVTLGTFTSTNLSAKASQFGAIIYWNDGTTSGGTVTSIGATPGGQTFSVKGTHTYIATGVHPITIEIVHAGGSSIAGTAQDVVTAAPLTSTGEVISASGGVPVTATVATFTDANPTNFSTTAYTAIIDWGDGSPESAGTIVANPAGGYSVVGTHTYSNAYGSGGLAAYYIRTTITDVGGASTVALGAALTSYVATPLTGILDPSSDTGVSSTDAITKDNRPTFLGTSAPGSTVVIFAQSTATGSTAFPIAQTTTDAGGNYTATVTTAIPDGKYIVTATASDSLGNTLATTTILPATSPLVIDTVAPVVTNVYFNRVAGQIDVTFQDALSGLDIASITNAANYTLTKKDTAPGTYVLTGITTSTPTSNGSVTAVLTFNGGVQIRGGYYNFTILSGPTGVQDIAGNDLAGTFYGTFPSGNGAAGNFVAALDAIHHKVYAPASLTGSSIGVVTAPPTIIPTANPELSTASVSTASKTVAAESLQSTILGTTADLTTHDAALEHVAKSTRRKA